MGAYRSQLDEPLDESEQIEDESEQIDRSK
jgi:hypothetical protein